MLKPWGLTPDNAELERSAVYRFQARWAKQWNKGRCLIGGDAAHLMPPFAGEGMCAGVRDAVAMAWRLNGILEGRFGLEVLGIVEAGGKRDRFDQVVGQGWVLLGLDVDPAEALTAAQRRQLAALDGVSVRLAAPGGQAMPWTPKAPWAHGLTGSARATC